MKIIETDGRNKDNLSIKPSYRVSISFVFDEIVIRREYFYYGYYENIEDFDNFWFDDKKKYQYGNLKNLNKASFITNKLKDKEYLKTKEKELIKAFYDRLIENEKDIIKEKKEKIKEYDKKIKDCHKNIENEFFIKFKRKDKLKKLNENR